MADITVVKETKKLYSIDTTPPGIENYAFTQYKILPHPHFQLIGVNSEEL